MATKWSGRYFMVNALATVPRTTSSRFLVGRNRAVTMSQLYQHASKRARLARVHRRLSGVWKYILMFLSLALLGIGVLALVNSQAFGWAVASLALWPLMPLLWDERYLKNLPANRGKRLDDRLEVDLLARLPAKLNRTNLVEAMGQSRSVQFMMVRAGLSPQLLSDGLDDEKIMIAWQHALGLRPSGVVRASELFAGLISVDPVAREILPRLQLDLADVDEVANWYDRLEGLISDYHAPRFTGGVARDWSFGYTPVLSRFGVNISEQVSHGVDSTLTFEPHQEALSFMKQIFSSGGRQNVALVGPTGSGKTAIVKAFASLLLSSNSQVSANLKFRQVVSLNAASLISAASGRGEIEELLNTLLVEAYRAKNIILCLDDAQLFFEDGVGSVDVSNLLQPALDGGVLRVILTMDEQRFLQISQRNPALAQSLNRFSVVSASQSETIRVMQEQLLVTEYQQKATYMYQALHEAYRLSERYLYDLAQPGKALQLLSVAGQYAESGLVTAVSVQRAIEQTRGIKVGSNATADDKELLLNLESRIHERMINQTRAVTLVSDALRRARAGVRNEKRPIGTFLFLGPTGVGKTELAKSLASVYFNGEDQLLRLDMNEFVGPNDVNRLIADGADDPNSLCAQVAKQPFSVVLLDELEKAHDSVLTALLQVLDEGILRDIKGREVSFRDAIIIATSNAGADRIRQHIELGEELEQFESALTDELISSGQFRSEFLNRFDEIVLFRPLKPAELVQVVDGILAGVNKTLEPQKIAIEVAQELKEWLVVNGNDPRLGARPMRRMVQRVVESTVAKRLLAGEVQPGETVSLTLADLPTEMKG